MRIYPALLKERKRVFNIYNDAFSRENWAVVPPAIVKGKESSYHIYALRIRNITEKQRDQMIDEISKTGVAVNVHFIPLPMLTFFKEKGFNIKDYPQAYHNFKCEISLPIYPQLTEEQLAYVIKAVKNAYKTVIG
jgi:dTDP-4-amino-4,6-dideoxygalactose transaminase